MCQELHIEHHFFTFAYLQGNGQTEASNKTIIMVPRKRLESSKAKCVEKLPGILWAYRVLPHSEPILLSLWGRGSCTHESRVTFPMGTNISWQDQSQGYV